jgi:hypothetical protein
MLSKSFKFSSCFDRDDNFNCVQWMKRRKQLREAKLNIPVRNNQTPVKRLFSPRLVYPIRQPKQGKYWEYTLGGTYADPTSRDGIIFRRRFRVPYVFLLNLSMIFEHSNGFQRNKIVREKKNPRRWS